MKTQTIKITSRHGREIVKGNGDYYRLRLSTGEIITGTMKPTFGYKLRRFCRRLINTANAKFDEIQTYPHMYYDLPLIAAEVPFIGIEESHYVQ